MRAAGRTLHFFDIRKFTWRAVRVLLRGTQDYKLLSPMGKGRLWSSFLATAGGESLVELRILDTESVSDSEQDLELRRLQLLALVEHPAIRRIVEVVAKNNPPFAVFEHLNQLPAHTPNCCKAEACHKLFDGLASAHRFGVIAGWISAEDVRARDANDWLLDLTSERMPRSGPTIPVDPHESLMDTFQGADPASDVYSLSCALRQIAESMLKSGVTLQEDVAQLLAKVVVTDMEARPAAETMASEFLKFTAGGQKSYDRKLSGTVFSPPSVDDRFSRTLNDFESPERIVAIPLKLGRFTVHEQLGAGSAGVVHRATDQSNDQIVALKILNSTVAQNKSMLRRFTREARLLAQVGSPFVARLLDANSDQGLHFLAIEFIAGGTLNTAMQKATRLDERKTLRLILDVLNALAVAHQQGIVHRDIKPENILLTTAGQTFLDSIEPVITQDTVVSHSDPAPLVKLTDFGLARADHSSESMAVTQDGTILGTPLYMSPEQSRGTAIDARSDIYSVGATLFHMLAGRPPFVGDNTVSLMNAICHDPLPPLRQISPNLSDGCIAVVEKCLAKNADARYPDAASLQADIERLLHGEATSMVLHPATPTTNGLKVTQLQFYCDLKASPAQLWPYVANTDRVNHALGLSTVSYTNRTDPIRGVERFAESKIAGQKIVWQEHPYEWIEGRRLSVLREFSSGPFLWFMNIIDMQLVSGGGTRVTQTLKFVPHSWIGKLLVKFVICQSTPKSFRRVYQQIDDWLSRPENLRVLADPFGTTGAMTRPGRVRLNERIGRLNERRLNPNVIETLRQFLEHASDPEVARIRPLVFAERFQLPANDVINVCLFAAKEGALMLLWDILCPSCRIPADVQETLATLKDHGYCPACDLRFEIDFANSVELIFRSHPDIRMAETRTYCIGGPAFSAHVVAQTRLMPGERFQMELMLTEGSYRIRGPQLPFVVDVRVSSAGGASRFELPLQRPPLPNSVPTLQQGQQVLTLFNNTIRELQIRLERTADRSMAVTAASAASIPTFREMFPNEILAPGQIVSVTNLTLLTAEVCGAGELYQRLGDGQAFGKIRSQLLQVDATVRSYGGAVVKTVGDGVLATFQESQSALAALAALLVSRSESLPVRLALHRSSALVTTLNDRLDYFGEALHLLRTMLQMSDANEAIVTASVLPVGEHGTVPQSDGLQIVPLENILADTTIVAYRCRRLEDGGSTAGVRNSGVFLDG
jgi:serine/threonine protein kinase/class 3 adenylate cyclase